MKKKIILFQILLLFFSSFIFSQNKIDWKNFKKENEFWVNRNDEMIIVSLEKPKNIKTFQIIEMESAETEILKKIDDRILIIENRIKELKEKTKKRELKEKEKEKILDEIEEYLFEKEELFEKKIEIKRKIREIKKIKGEKIVLLINNPS